MTDNQNPQPTNHADTPNDTPNPTDVEVVEGELTSDTPSDKQTNPQDNDALTAARREAEEFKSQWLRAVADYKNYKRRAEQERAELTRSASAGLLLKLLPIVDDFERAEAGIPAHIADDAWWGGTRLIGQKLRMLLESEGVTPIAAVGEDFDPNLHDAVMYEDAPGQDGKVVEELQKGYRLNERVLRPTMVKVGRG